MRNSLFTWGDLLWWHSDVCSCIEGDSKKLTKKTTYQIIIWFWEFACIIKISSSSSSSHSVIVSWSTVCTESANTSAPSGVYEIKQKWLQIDLLHKIKKHALLYLCPSVREAEAEASSVQAPAPLCVLEALKQTPSEQTRTTRRLELFTPESSSPETTHCAGPSPNIKSSSAHYSFIVLRQYRIKHIDPCEYLYFKYKPGWGSLTRGVWGSFTEDSLKNFKPQNNLLPFNP